MVFSWFSLINSPGALWELVSKQHLSLSCVSYTVWMMDVLQTNLFVWDLYCKA